MDKSAIGTQPDRKYNLPMAGFGVIMELLALGLIGLIVAFITSVLLVWYAKRTIPSGASHRRKILQNSAAAPFLGFLWVIVAFIIHVFVANHFAHQDCGFGLSPDPFVTLPNGYQVGSANTYDGYFEAPGFTTDVPSEGPGYVRDLVTLHFENGFFTGTHLDRKSSSIRAFRYDTRTRDFEVLGDSSNADPSSGNEMEMFGKVQTLVHTSPDSYWVMYREYRYIWPTYEFLFLVIVGELLIAYWCIRILRTGELAPE
jgi:hypothetical protein